MLPIKGFQKTSLVDFPPHIVSTIFLGGCNFRCSYCQNPDLVKRQDSIPTISEGDVINHLKRMKGKLDGLCVTGGECCLYDLSDFLSKVKKEGFLVKLDTNGSFPERLKKLLDKQLVDYVAMDVKAPLEGYEEVVKAKVDINKIKESIELLKTSGIDYEFRTTVVPGVLTKEDIVAIGTLLKGSKKYTIQQFRSNVPLMDSSLEGRKGYEEEELNAMKDAVKEFFEEVNVVNV